MGLNELSKVSQLGRSRIRNSSSHPCPEPDQPMSYSFVLLPKHFGKWKVKLKFFQFLGKCRRAYILRPSFHAVQTYTRRLEVAEVDYGGATPVPTHCSLIITSLSYHFLGSISHRVCIGWGSAFRFFFFLPRGINNLILILSRCLSSINSINNAFLLLYGSFVWFIFSVKYNSSDRYCHIPIYYVSGTNLSPFTTFFIFLITSKVGIISPILQMRKLMLREVKK